MIAAVLAVAATALWLGCYIASFIVGGPVEVRGDWRGKP